MGLGVNKVLCVQNYGCSGSLLFQSLLDGHPEVIGMPTLYARELLYCYEKHHHEPVSELVDGVINEFPYWFEVHPVNKSWGACNLGPSDNEAAIVDRIEFKKALSQRWGVCDEMNLRVFLNGIFLAYNDVKSRKYPEDAWLLFPIHSMPHHLAKMLCDAYAEVKFLYTIRDPRQNLPSLMNHISKYDVWRPLSLLECGYEQIVNDVMIHGGGYEVYGYKPHFEDSQDIVSRGIRLEDLHLKTPLVMEAICQWLKIQWNDSLLDSTFDGLSWHNRPESIRQTGTGTKTITQKYAEVSTPFDEQRYSILSRSILNFYEYSSQDKLVSSPKEKMLLLVPFKVEYSLKRFWRQWQCLNQADIPHDLIDKRARMGRIGFLFKNQLKRSKLMNVFIVSATVVEKYIMLRKKMFKTVDEQKSNKPYVKLLNLTPETKESSCKQHKQTLSPETLPA